MISIVVKTARIFIVSILLLHLVYLRAFSQATQIKFSIINTNDSYYTDIPLYIKVNAINNGGSVDQTYNGTVTLEASGPDTLAGETTVNFTNGSAVFEYATLHTEGIYQMRCSSPSLITSAVKTITVEKSPFTKTDATPTLLKCWDEMYDTVYTGNFFSKYVFAVNANNEIDTTFGKNYVGTGATVQQISGTTISGITNKKAYFNEGVGIASQIKIAYEGTYQLVYSYAGLVSDTFTIVVVDEPFDSSNCIIPDSIQAQNMGLYGIVANDFTFSSINNRLFVGGNTPYSLFFSDDTAKTWTPSFSYDSLEYNCGTRGWGGGCKRILTNTKGWVAVHISQSGSSQLSASVVSFQNGDTGTWCTAMDKTIGEEWGYGKHSAIRGIALTDYYIYSLYNNYIFLQDTDVSFPKKVLMLSKTLSPTNSLPIPIWLAAANTASGYPFYIIIDTSGNTGSSQGALFKYDGISYTALSLPASFSSIKKVFMHPKQISLDTVFIYGTDNNGTDQIFRSFDGGLNWTSISSNEANSISDFEYSDEWINGMPNSNGAVLIGNGSISKDMGQTWEINPSGMDIYALLPTNPDYVIKLLGGAIYYNTTGLSGPLERSRSLGLAATSIFKMDKSDDKSEFYFATQSGLAYTTAYLDTTVPYVDKWKSPYGQYPVTSLDSTLVMTALAIDPGNQSHVIIGNSDGLYVTTTGVQGFGSSTVPQDFRDNIPLADIKFVNPSIVLALKGDGLGDMNSIWRTTDGGNNWSKVSTDTIAGGIMLCVASWPADTVVYMGSGIIDFYNSKGKLWKSDDLGQNWSQLMQGPACPNNVTNTNMAITALAANQAINGNLYVGASSGKCNALLFSQDKGSTFSFITLPNDTDKISSIALNKNNSDSVYIAVGREIYVYDALKDSIVMVYRGLPGEEIYDLASGSILAGTATGFYGLELDHNGTYVKTNTVEKDELPIKIYPNPAANDFYIEVAFAKETDLYVSLFDCMGREVSMIARGENVKGKKYYYVNSSLLVSGTYVVKIKTDSLSVSKKIVLIH